MGRLCHAGCALMLLACLAIGGMWRWSYDAKAILRLPVSAGSTRIEIFSYRGQLAISAIPAFPTALRCETLSLQTSPARAARWDMTCWEGSLAGFIVEDGRITLQNIRQETVARNWYRVIFPYWVFLALALPLPLREIYLAVRTHRRSAHGQCAQCGYACDGFVDYSRCPACAARQQVVGVTPRTRLA